MFCRTFDIFCPPLDKFCGILCKVAFFSDNLQFSVVEREILHVAENWTLLVTICYASSDKKSIDSKLLDTLAWYNIHQHLKFGTHEKGNLFDLILTSTVDDLVSAVSVKPVGISDHLLVTCKLSVHSVNTTSVTCIYRNLKAIDICSFCNAIQASWIYDDIVMSSASATEYVDIFSKEVGRLLDQLATKRKPTNDCCWQRNEARDARRRSRRLERRYIRTRMEEVVVHKMMPVESRI